MAETTSAPPLVRVTRRLPPETEARLASLFDCRFNAADAALGREGLIEAVADAEILVATIGDPVDAGVFAAAGPQLRLVANFGAGVDHIDLAAAAGRGIAVTNTPGVNAVDTAEVALGLLLALSHRFGEGEAQLRGGGWSGWSPTSLLGWRLAGRRLGILGLGAVGAAVARSAKSLGMELHYHNRRPIAPALAEELGATFWDSLGGLLSHVEVLTVHCPLNDETRGMLGAPELRLLPKGALLVNTSRGGIVDEEALAGLLEEGHLGGAGLDVYETAPHVRASLLAAPNTVLLPHIASATRQARRAMGERVILNIRSLLDGHAPPDRVLPPG